ncbi:MAG: hypothetical protein R3F44_16380 [Candidatus Competibacteraceae bacterium]
MATITCDFTKQFEQRTHSLRPIEYPESIATTTKASANGQGPDIFLTGRTLALAEKLTATTACSRRHCNCFNLVFCRCLDVSRNEPERIFSACFLASPAEQLGCLDVLRARLADYEPQKSRDRATL